jgi:hypothetical protein
MKNFVLFGLTLLFTFKSMLPFVEYYLNYDYIVAELCEQKEEENNACNGQCHLAKKIQDTTDSEAPSENKSIHIIDFCESIKSIDFGFACHLTEKKSILYQKSILSKIHLDVPFPPPNFC